MKGILSRLRPPHPDTASMQGLREEWAATHIAIDRAEEVLRSPEAREVIRTVMWRHKQYTTTGPVRCSCGHWKPDAGMFDMHLAEEIQKALAGDDE